MKRSLGKSLSWLNTPAVLYLVVAIALSNLFFFLYNGDVRHTMIFVLVGVITSFFSKNMIVILTMAVAFTGIAKMVSLNGSLEGMTDGEEDNEHTDAVSSSEPDASSSTNKKKKSEGEEIDATENMEGNDDDDDDDDEKEPESFEMIKKDGKELIKVQDKIEAGFKELEPYMDKADQLLTRIEESMATLEKQKK